MITIYTVSNNILFGKAENTLCAYICESLFKNNFMLSETQCISENCNFAEVLELQGKNEITIFLTESFCDGLNQFLCNTTNTVMCENPYAKNAVMERLKRTDEILSQSLMGEFQMPAKARAIVNKRGYAHGYILKNDAKTYIVLPCHFKQGKAMFDDVVLPYLKENQDRKYISYVFKTFGLSNYAVKEIIKQEYKNKDRVKVYLFAKDLSVDIILKSTENNKKIHTLASSVFQKLDRFIYSVEDVSAKKTACDLLKLNNLQIAFCEGATSGKLCSTLCEESSNAVVQSFVFNDVQKIFTTLNIDETLKKENNGANAEVAYKMISTMLAISDCQIALSNIKYQIDENKVISYIAIGDKNQIHVYKNTFIGSHAEIINTITFASIFYLIKKLKKNDYYFEKNEI